MNVPLKVLLSWIIVTTTIIPSYASGVMSHDTQEMILDVMARTAYPVGVISAQDDYEYLKGFPTFVEVTDNDCKMLMKQGAATISFKARFSDCDEPLEVYKINNNFFSRPKHPGLYQPDYPVYTRDNTYYYDGVTSFYHDYGKYNVTPFLHQVHTFAHVTQIFPECSLAARNTLKSARGQLTHLGGTCIWGDEIFAANGDDYFGDIPFTPDLRGVVFVLDGDDEANMFIPRIRALTVMDLHTMERSGELKIKVK